MFSKDANFRKREMILAPYYKSGVRFASAGFGTKSTIYMLFDISGIQNKKS
jgi:hypothetical protein